ncbi:hypothetical protein BaRGS_00002424 [Batillaria attramentaria]|uniref:Uncharacterized protein n=1 Tax=Batillaria attramentaria TaxID=370345 RepID=A0ABD0M3P3_9CAEN
MPEHILWSPEDSLSVILSAASCLLFFLALSGSPLPGRFLASLGTSGARDIQVTRMLRSRLQMQGTFCSEVSVRWVYPVLSEFGFPLDGSVRLAGTFSIKLSGAIWAADDFAPTMHTRMVAATIQTARQFGLLKDKKQTVHILTDTRDAKCD